MEDHPLKKIRKENSRKVNQEKEGVEDRKAGREVRRQETNDVSGRRGS